jgi:hypothetical protein
MLVVIGMLANSPPDYLYDSGTCGPVLT